MPPSKAEELSTRLVGADQSRKVITEYLTVEVQKAVELISLFPPRYDLFRYDQRHSQ
jgi:hypothetical protein